MTNTYGRILSVDDDTKVLEKVATYLEDIGFIVNEASNGQEALAIFNEKKPDLVLCDLQMPVMNGLELIEALTKKSPETPIIAMSHTDKMNIILDALRLGAWDFIAKPIMNMTVLEHVICKALERGRLVIENKKYRKELEEKNVQLTQSLGQLKEDQNAGKSVQQKLLPAPNFLLKNYTFAHKVIPSLYLSGDFVDYFQITQNKVGFYIADVSGHGASSAFVTVLLKSLVEHFLNNYQLRGDDTILNPDKVLKHLSDDILNAKLGKYLTMIYCVLDLDENKLFYSIGGHYPNPVIWDGVESRYLEGSGFAVGIFKDAKFVTHSYLLPEEFSLAMFSDGIFEIMSGADLKTKEKKLLSLVNNSQLVIEDVLSPLGVKEGDCPDDITLFLMNRKALCNHMNK
ncbi:MAG: SpoIIE family protein phosphatase [Candidatus Berkiella sp.]